MENEGKLDVASRARMMSRRLKVMQKSPALVKLEDVDDEERKRLLLNRGGRIRSSARHQDTVQTRMKRFNLDSSEAVKSSSNVLDNDKEAKTTEFQNVNFKEKLKAIQSSVQTSGKNVLTLNEPKFERSGHESVRNIRITLSTRKKNLQEQQILKALQKNQANEGSYPIPLPRQKKRVISVRKRAPEKELTIQSGSEGEKEGEDASVTERVPPKKPPRRKLRISTVRRENREERRQHIDKIEEETLSKEGHNEGSLNSALTQEKPVPQKRRLRVRRSSSKDASNMESLSTTKDDIQDKHNSVKTFKKHSNRASLRESRQKVPNDGIVESINSGLSISFADHANSNEPMSESQQQRPSRKNYRKMFLQTFLAAGESEERLDENTKENSSSTENEVENQSVSPTTSSLSDIPTTTQLKHISSKNETKLEMSYSIDDITQVLEPSCGKEHETPSNEPLKQSDLATNSELEVSSTTSGIHHASEDAFTETRQDQSEKKHYSSELNACGKDEATKMNEDETKLTQLQSTNTDLLQTIQNQELGAENSYIPNQQQSEVDSLIESCADCDSLVVHDDVSCAELDHEASEEQKRENDIDNEDRNNGNRKLDVICVEPCPTVAPTKTEPARKEKNKSRKVLKKSASYSEGIISSSSVNTYKFFQISKEKLKNLEIVKKSCYVQTDESFLLSKNAKKEQQNGQNFEEKSSVQNMPCVQLAAAENQVSEYHTNFMNERVLKDDKTTLPESHQQETCIEEACENALFYEEKVGQEKTNIESKEEEASKDEDALVKQSLEDEENSDDEFEIEYSYVDEDGNELPLDEAILDQGLSLIEGSDDEIELVYDDESDKDSLEELLVYLDDDGNYVDEDGYPVELDVDSEDEIVYDKN